MAGFLFYLVMPYILGRINSDWLALPFLPAVVIPLLLMFFGSVALFAFSIRACLTGLHISATISMFIASVALFLASFEVPKADLFQRGFNDYARTILTADEWRQIAGFAQSHFQPGVRFWGPYVHESDTNNALLPAFNAATPIQKLGTTYSIFVSPKTTEIFWGGALTGHRGVVVFSGQHPSSQDFNYSDLTFVTNDIATYVGG